METMDKTLDETPQTTISLLESRLLRLEHLVFGATTSQTAAPATRSIQELEHRLATLLQRVRVYGEILKLYQSHPTFFQPPAPSEPPPELSGEALRAIVLSSAPSFSATASALTAISDTPIPDAADSAALTALLPRMKGVEAIQSAQAAEISELRVRSELAVKHWYEHCNMYESNVVSRFEGRIEDVERTVRQVEKSRAEV